MTEPSTSQRPGIVSGVGKGGAILVLAGSAILGGMKMWEEQVLYVYPDRLAKGLPTFCSGSTDWEMPLGKTFTVEQCDDIDAKVAVKYGAAILKCVNNEQLNQEILDAFTLFAVNVGTGGACGSRAVRLLNQGLIKDACRAMRYGPNGEDVWVYANGKFIRGLANRRSFEQNWCLGLAKPPDVVSTVVDPITIEIKPTVDSNNLIK